MAIGIITEQGDLGLGFDQLNNKDQKIYNEAVKATEEHDKQKKDNEPKEK